MSLPETDAALLAARALVVADLGASGLDTATLVSTVEAAALSRAWWVQEWPQGARYVAGLLAQDVQEVLLEDHGLRWPPCPGTPGNQGPGRCGDAGPHELHVVPDLGEDPHWVCEESGTAVAPVGRLRSAAAG